MQYKFLNIFLDPKELLAQAKDNANPFLLENNSSQIEKIYNFYKGDANLLYVNGFLGTGKVKLVDYSLTFLSTETIILKYNCFNSTVLDDVLLSFFSEFKKLSAQNIISEPKIRTENFTQKVNSYFSQIEKPFVIIFDSFEAVLEENRQKIIDFILHLSSIQKVKIIIIGRAFESKYFENINLERVTTFALEKPIFERYLKSEKIKASGPVLDELYKHTRGYYFFTALSVRLMKNEALSLFDFLTKFKNSFLPFFDFLGKEALKLVPTSEKHLFWFLSLIRHSISVDLLKKLEFYDEEKINFLIENLIIIDDKSQLYVQDYLKEWAYDSIAPNIAQKIRQYIIDLYSTQLPLKPLERNICISRQTMRKEIEYHKFFLPQKPKGIKREKIDINYLSYSKILDFGDKNKPEEVAEEEKPADLGLDLTQRKNISINIENLPFQSKEKIPASVANADLIEEESKAELSLSDIMEKAKQSEIEYHYANAVNLLQKALSLKDDKDYQSNLPSMYTKIAHAYQKNANYDNALKYYDLAQKLYEGSNDLIKANYVKFNTAKAFYETYQIDKAKELFLDIVSSKKSPTILTIKSYLQLANIEEGSSNPEDAFEYYKQAIEISNRTDDIETLSELYFKYALALDDKNDTKTAIEFYNKCIDLSDDFNFNKSLSPAYSNIATLYLEKNDTQNAVKNYLKAYEIDQKSVNLEGMYYSSSKLASILQKAQPEKALEYLHTALDCAKSTKDVFYIASASLSLGDYHYDRQQNEIALKHYLYAFDLAKADFSQDNINKINVRINDIKFRLGVEKFENLAEIIREQENG